MCNLPTPPTVNNRIPIRIPITGAQIAGSGVLTFIQRIGMGPLIASSERLVNSDSCLTLPSNAQTVPAGFYSFNSSLTNAFTREANPLAIGEWIKFFGLFFGPDGMRNAQTEFTKMDNTFQCITSATSAYRTRVTPDKYPVIGAYQANNGVVERVVDEMDWIGLGLAAGANFSVLPTSSAPLATWKDLAKTVDVVFDFSNPENDAYDMKTFLKNYGLPDAQQGVYPFLDNTNSKVFRYDLQRHNSSGVVDYDQARYAQPDLLLAELIYIMDPSFNRAYRPYWFEALNNGNTPSLQAPF
ncbi:hypothetical protein BC829DRAFT_16589 [Chytridium lagenaria]|nr:hypothetical protein BC829DRAFT_16589 [Chytridium lagenaria]